jgi:hypothetical protein
MPDHDTTEPVSSERSEQQFRRVMGQGRGSGRAVATAQPLPIYRYLDLSTAHVTENECTALTSSSRSEALPRCIEHEYGVWVHVPAADDDEDCADEGEPSSVVSQVS